MPELLRRALLLALLVSAVLIAVVHSPRRAVWLLVVQSCAWPAWPSMAAWSAMPATSTCLSPRTARGQDGRWCRPSCCSVVERTEGWDDAPMYLGRRNVLVLALALMLLPMAWSSHSLAGTLMTAPTFPPPWP